MRRCSGLSVLMTMAAFLFLSASSAIAQITITMDDVPTGIGENWTHLEGKNPINFDVVSTGANYTWNFSHVDTLEYVPVTETILDPALSQFEDVTLLYDWQMEVAPGMIYIRKVHADLSASSLLMKAMEAFSEPPGDSLTWVFDPGVSYYQFPMTYGSNWASTTDGVMYGNGVPGDSLRSKYDFEVDGWGNVATPYETVSSLRMLIYLYQWDFDLGAWEPPDTTYLWVTNDPELRLVFEVSDYETGEYGKEGYVRLYDPTGAGVSGDNELPRATKPALAGNYPNPFNPVTNIRFVLPAETRATLRIYDITGRLVKTLVDETMPAGEHSAVWRGRNGSGGSVSSGVYMFELRAGETCETGRMLLLK